jgi:RNA polymerase sigma factor (sigma-70 family)
MAKGERKAHLQHLHTLFDLGTTGGLTDGKLLEWYTSGAGEAAEAAFAALVERHGPMVFRVCRAILHDEDAAHDAFQATFLVLVRRARVLWTRDSLAPWLHQVAYRVAQATRLAAIRRQHHERKRADLRAQAVRGDDDDRADRARLIHEELGRLPEHQRAVIVLCDLEGLTQQQAARQLGWPLGTVQSRLARGRRRLRDRLVRHGLAPSAGLLGGADAARAATGAVPAWLMETTARAAHALRTGGATAGAVPAAVAQLVEGELRTMFLIQARRIAAVLLVLGAAAAGAAVLARPQAEDAPANPPRNAARAAAAAYVVEPPDMIRVEVLEALRGRPISGERLVRPDGKIALGFYGEVDVAGMTTAEIKEAVIAHLRKYLGDEQLGLVEPDPQRPGRSRRVAPADSTRVYVDVQAYNSKVYYVLGEVSAPGRLPVTGNDTVLDAINYAGGLYPSASRRLRLVRKPAQGSGRPQILEVDYTAITNDGDAATNYRLQPGDRLIVPRDPEARTESTTTDRPAAPAAADVAALERKLEAVEHKLDQVLELLGGTRSRPSSPRSGVDPPRPREER